MAKEREKTDLGVFLDVNYLLIEFGNYMIKFIFSPVSSCEQTCVNINQELYIYDSYNDRESN